MSGGQMAALVIVFAFVLGVYVGLTAPLLGH